MRKVLHKNLKKQGALENAVVSLVRDRLFQSCRYHLAKNEISADEREVLNAMFDAYFDLGGNGVVKHLKGEIDE